MSIATNDMEEVGCILFQINNDFFLIIGTKIYVIYSFTFTFRKTMTSPIRLWERLLSQPQSLL